MQSKAFFLHITISWFRFQILCSSVPLLCASSSPSLSTSPPHTAGGGGSLQRNEKITTPFNHHRWMEDTNN